MALSPSSSIARRSLVAVALTVGASLTPALAGSGIPSYPSAKPESIATGGRAPVVTCGRTIVVQQSLSVDADPRTIAKWYAAKLAGAHIIDLDKMSGEQSTGGLAQMTSLEVIPGDGAHVVVVQRMTFNSAQAKSAGAMMGMDKATIGIESITPPFPSGYGALAAQATSGGAAAASAKQQIAAECKG